MIYQNTTRYFGILIVSKVIYLFSLLLFLTIAFSIQVRGEEGDDIKKQIQELRQQVQQMQQKLEQLEKKNTELEQQAKEKQEEKKTEEEIGKIPEAPIPREGFFQRALQTLNPDISVIGTFAPAYFSTDDPIVHTPVDPENTGINLQELEVGFQAVIDPYFRADTFFALKRNEFEIEEAYATTLLTLPLNLQTRAGLMRSKFGRINLQHREVQDFVTLALPAADFLGEHLNPIGAEFNFLLPLPWFSELSASVNSSNGLETLPLHLLRMQTI